MSNKLLFIPTEIDVTDDKVKLISLSKKYLDGVKLHADAAIEEHIIGFRFIVISSTDGFDIVADEKYNKSVNPDYEFGVEEFTEVLGRWPKIAIDSFRYAPIPDYTMHIIYFNHDMIKDLPVNYPPEGLFIADIIPHENGYPLSAKHKENFLKSMGFTGLPCMFIGTFDHGYQRLDAIANSSVIANQNYGYGARVTFEPRLDNTIYYLKATNASRMENVTDTTQTFVEELANFIWEPKHIIDVYKRKNKHPRTQRKTFTKLFVKTMELDMPDMFHDYFDQARVLLENYTYEQFLTDIEAYLYKHGKEFISQIKEL